MTETHLIFVYGTLRRGMGNNVLLQDSNFIDCLPSPPVYSINGWGRVPFISYIGREKGASILGEIYEINSNTLARLDSLEGHPNFYKREKRMIGDFECWVYEINNGYERGDFTVGKKDEPIDWVQICAEGGYYG